MDIGAKLVGFDLIERALHDLPGAMAGRALQSATNFGAGAFQLEARRILRGYGYDKRTWQGVIKKNRRRGKYSAATRVGYARSAAQLNLLEHGSRPHSIKAQKAKVLGYKLPSGGWVWFTARSVQHPGHHAKPWLRPAFDTKQQQAIERFGKKAWQRIEAQARRARKLGVYYGRS